MKTTGLRLFGTCVAVAAATALASCDKPKPQETKAAPAAPAAPTTTLPQALATALLDSDGRHTAKFTSPDEIFAHAPTTMHAVLFDPLHLRGIAGIKAQPADKPVCGNGVEYVISQVAPDGQAKVLFTTKIAPNGAYVPFDVQLEKGSTLQMETKDMGNTDCDWAYWGQLQTAP